MRERHLVQNASQFLLNCADASILSGRINVCCVTKMERAIVLSVLVGKLAWSTLDRGLSAVGGGNHSWCSTLLADGWQIRRALVRRSQSAGCRQTIPE